MKSRITAIARSGASGITTWPHPGNRSNRTRCAGSAAAISESPGTRLNMWPSPPGRVSQRADLRSSEAFEQLHSPLQMRIARSLRAHQNQLRRVGRMARRVREGDRAAKRSAVTKTCISAEKAASVAQRIDLLVLKWLPSRSVHEIAHVIGEAEVSPTAAAGWRRWPSRARRESHRCPATTPPTRRDSARRG